MAQPLEFRILGPVGLWHGGYEAPLKGSKQKTLLAALLLANGRALTDYQLSEVLWGSDAPSTHQAQIYTYASRLRHHLDTTAWIARQGPGYLLKTGSALFDYQDFTTLARAGRSALGEGRYHQAAELLSNALSRWRGPTLTGVTEMLADSVRPRIDEEWADTLENRIEAELAMGHHDRLTSELIGLVAAHPLRERMRAQLMTALYRSDQQAQAFATYQQGCHLLAEEFGVDPGPTLRNAYQAILTGDLAQSPTAPATVELRAPVPVGAPLAAPVAAPDFTGRADELAIVAGELQRSEPRRRVILVHGISGSGKTMFAVEVASRHAAEFPDGCLFLDLRGSRPDALSPDQAISQLLDELGVPPGALPAHPEQRIQLYRSTMAQRRMLLILDDAASEKQVRCLATTAAAGQTIVTSRHRLPALEGQVAIRLDGLRPEEGLALLDEIVGGQRLQADPAAARRIVAHCSGLPLALRIVGVRLASKPHWPVSRLAHRLDDDDDRLDELSVSDLNVRTGLAETFTQLSDLAGSALMRVATHDERTLTAATIGAALGLADEAAERLTEHLSHLHLLTPEGIDRHGRDRYRIHPLARLLAREQASTAGVPWHWPTSWTPHPAALPQPGGTGGWPGLRGALLDA